MPVLGALQSTGGIISSLAQPISGRVSDRVGRKPFIVLRSLLTVVGFFLCIIANTWHFLIPSIILLSTATMGGPALRSLLAESVEPEERGTAFSVVSFPAALTGLFAPVMGGLLATHYGFESVFYLSVLTHLLALALIAIFIKETLRERSFGTILIAEEAREALRGVFKPERGLRGFYAVMTLNAFSVGMLGSIFYGMLTKTFGFTPYQLGVIGALFWIAIAISQIPAGKLADRYGRKGALTFSGVMFILLCLGWLFSTSFEMFAILHFLAGVSVSSWGPASSALLADSVPEEKRAEAMGTFTCFTGLVSSPASYISGNLYELFGFRGPIVATLILKVVILLIIFLFVQEERGYARI
jgi:MFS family permease